jgi:glutamate-1-semialdehyde 2,1-aminomutase
MLFGEDPGLAKIRYFCGEAARRGIYIHPHHNWFLSAAHTEADIKQTLEVAEECFKLTRQKFAG